MSEGIEPVVIELFDRFVAELDGKVGRGPRHLTSPRPALQAAIERFLDEYPVLRRDPGYVAFQELYAGAEADGPDGLLVVFYGFLRDLGLHMTQDEGPVVDDGLLTFATVQVRVAEGADGIHEYVDLAFSFDVDGRPRSGVYRHVGELAGSWYCRDFVTWLRRLIDRRGRLHDDPPEEAT